MKMLRSTTDPVTLHWSPRSTKGHLSELDQFLRMRFSGQTRALAGAGQGMLEGPLDGARLCPAKNAPTAGGQRSGVRCPRLAKVKCFILFPLQHHSVLHILN